MPNVAIHSTHVQMKTRREMGRNSLTIKELRSTWLSILLTQLISKGLETPQNRMEFVIVKITAILFKKKDE